MRPCGSVSNSANFFESLTILTNGKISFQEIPSGVDRRHIRPLAATIDFMP